MKKHIRLLTLAAISLAGFTYGNQLQASANVSRRIMPFSVISPIPDRTKFITITSFQQMNFIVPYYKDAIQILAFAEKEMIIIWHALHLPSIREYLYSILLIW